MTKTKRQLRAEAVERLKAYETWHENEKSRHASPDLLMAVIGGESWGDTWQENRDTLVSLLTDETDDENAPETPDFVENPQKTGFQGTENARNADELPEGDAVGIMYRALNNQNSPTFCALLRYLGISNGISASWDEAEDALRMLADMVERDYVRWEGMYDEVLAERNEWKARAEGAGSIELRACQSNLEWLMDTAFETVHDAPYSPLDTLAWLMSEHVDANGTCPDANGTPSNVDGTPSDAGDCGQIADMSGKRPDCVHDESEMSEVGSEVDTRDAPDTDGMDRVELRATIDSLRDELAASRRELKMARGELSVTLNNWEQAKGKLDRRKAELDGRERMLREREDRSAEELAGETVDALRAELAAAEGEREEYRSRLGRVLDGLEAIRKQEAM